MSCTTCLRGRLSPLTARLLSRAPGQSAAWKSFPKTQFTFAASKPAPTLSPKRREGHALSGAEGWGTQVPLLSANPHRINPFRLTPLNGIFYDKRLVFNILRAHGGRGTCPFSAFRDAPAAARWQSPQPWPSSGSRDRRSCADPAANERRQSRFRDAARTGAWANFRRCPAGSLE